MVLRSSRLSVVNIVLCGALAWVSWAQSEPQPPAAPPPPENQPKLETSDLNWNFGTVWQGEKLEYKVTLKNVGSAPLHISDVRTSCGCTTPTKPKPLLAPGESDTMTVSYASATKMGKAHQTVTVTTDDPAQQQVVIKVEGEVKPCYNLDPRAGLMFGSLMGSAHESRIAHIENLYPEPMHVTLKPGQDFGPFDISLRETEAGRRFELQADTKPPLTPGSVQANVTLLTGLERAPEIVVTAFGFVPLPIRAVPNTIYWPKSSVMEMNYTLWVSHAADRPMKVLGAEANHPAIKVTVEELTSGDHPPAEGQYKVTVTMPPGDRLPEDLKPEITIRTDAAEPDFQKVVVIVQVVGPPKVPAVEPPKAPAVGPPKQN